jgi:hypothetical protein
VESTATVLLKKFSGRGQSDVDPELPFALATAFRQKGKCEVQMPVPVSALTPAAP